MCRIWLISVLLSLSGCIARSEMYPSEGEETSPGMRRVSVRYLKSLYTGYATPLGEALEIRGWVTANDRYGTFPRTIWVEDDTGGIALKIAGEELFVDYPVGAEVSVQCRGLVLGGYGGEVSLGAASYESGYQNAYIDRMEAAAYVQVHEGLRELYASELQIGALTPVWIGAYVAFERVQFIDEEMGATWCDPQTDTDRHLVNPRGDTLIVRTGRQADFADRILPAGSGYIEGILGYFNSRYQLRVITHTRAMMDSPRFRVQTPDP